jgi:ATP-binding cassette, subfamily B, bacterial CvaB/MchF/RaxB
MYTINHLLIFNAKNKLPIIHQSEAAECGLACLVMVASYHGHKMDLATARLRFNVSLKGMTLMAMVNAAEKIELQARPLRVELDALDCLKCPTILHWDLSHFVVLKEINKTHAVIHDPARGKLTLTISELSNHFTGVALELIPSKQFKQIEESLPVKISDFWGRIQGLKRNLIQIFILSAILQVFVIIGPLIQQLVVDDAITKQDSDLLLVLVLGVVLIGLFQTIVGYVRSKIVLRLTNTLSFQMTANLFRHLIRLPLSYFEKRNIGNITTRFGSLSPIQNMISGGAIAIALDGIMAIVTLSMALMYSAKLTLILIGFISLGFAAQLLTFPYQKRRSQEIIETSAKEQSVFIENIQTATTIKIFGQETVRENIWLNRKADNMNASIELANFNIIAGSAGSVFMLAQTAFVTYLGARNVIDGTFSLGMLFAYQAYAGQFSSRLTAIFSQFMSFRMLDLHLQRLADVVHSKVEVENEVQMAKIDESSFRGKISVVNVRFRYGDDQPWILDGVNLTIYPGEMIAVKGASGGGKSTLLKIMLGLLKPTEGQVLIDDIELSTLNPASYRNTIGVVMQDDRLLAGSIADNISFYDPNINHDKVKDCAKMAFLHDDIKRNPMGYNTLVGERGSTLSGGQKQRLFLARAMYRDPKVLFLDEGTANLDAHTESEISTRIRSLDITRIVIAHRPALLNNSDKMFELRAGKIFDVSDTRTKEHAV